MLITLWILLNRYIFLDIVKSKVAVIIGLGTLGTSMLYYLIQMGVTNFILIDGDKVESRNLSHQHYYTKKDIGKYKVEAVKEHLSDYQELNIIVEANYFYDKKQLKKIITHKNKDDIYIFCAFDNLNNRLLCTISEINFSYNTYIAGYNRNMVFATVASNSFLENYKKEVEKYDTIKDNSGVGFLGDLTALLMLRLWLQKILPKLDYGLDYLEYSLFDNKNSIINNYLINKKLNVTNKEFFFKYVLESSLNSLYSQYLLNGNDNILEEIKNWCHKFNICAEEIAPDKDNYVLKRDSLCISYCGENINIKDFYNNIMPDIIMNAELAQQVDTCLKSLESETVFLINQKKKSVHYNYIKQINHIANQLPYLITLVRDINNKFLPNKKLDFLKYKPHISVYKYISLSDQIKQISRVDELIPNYSITQYIEFIKDHNFLKVSKQYKTSFTLFDKRYNVSTSFIKQEDNIWGLLTLGHELGHNYFVSFIESAETKSNINELTAETFAFINESLIIRQFMDIKHNRVFSSDFLFYLYRLISVPFSMDLYQQKVFSDNDGNLSWDKIIDKRLETVTTLFPGKTVENIKYSNHNISMNDDFLFNKTQLFLYPRAYILGFFIATCFIKDPIKYVNFIEYINTKKTVDITFILKDVFNISEKQAIKSGVTLLLKFLKNLN